ncbi:DUF3945 domain-containing protein [Chryseobacterium sp.]|uniref:DUF3945 domain-containing protein n=1 Tax=Chryseobacterium sp. TaxID=1871047 RepID=UPI00333F4E91
MSGRTLKKDNQTAESLSDILLVLDKTKNRIEAVKGVDDDGNLQTTEPKKSNLLDFMKVDKNDAVSNFFSNFWRRLKDPLPFRFFQSPIINLDEIAKKLQAAIENPTPEGNKLLEALEVKYDQKLKEKNKDSEQSADEEVEANFKYNVEDIDWSTLQKLNLNKELLEKSGQLDKMLKGYKSDGVYRIEGNFDGVVMKGDARLSLRNVNGKVVVMAHGVRSQPELKNAFYGHTFTREDKVNLLKTGNMGRIAELTHLDGSKVKALISIDQLTKEVVSFPIEHIKISDKFGGVQLNAEQKALLLEGKQVFIEGMTNTKTGEEFNQHLQYNADLKKLVFVGQSETMGQNLQTGIPSEFRGKVFTPDEKKQLEDGGVIDAKNLINKDETKLYSGYMYYDKVEGRMKFDFDNPLEDKAQKQSNSQAVGEASKQDEAKNAVENDIPEKKRSARQKQH